MKLRCFLLPFVTSALFLCSSIACTTAELGQSRLAAQQTQAVLPIRVEEIRRSIDQQPVRGWAALVDLADPRVEIRVTGPHERKADEPVKTEVYAETTPDWAREEGLVLAVNTHFFARADGEKGLPPAGGPTDLVGPCISAGRVISGDRDDGLPSPVLALTKDRRARIGMFTMTDLKGVDAAIAGISANAGKRGGLLVENGQNHGATALPRPEARHPRTAAGLSTDGRTLILLVIDGRQPEWSIGATLPELADIMIALGAATAINLDGGGSTSFVYSPLDGPQVINRPSGGTWRPVGASLGVYIRP